MGLPEAVSIFGSRAAVPLDEKGHSEKDEAAPTDVKALTATYNTELDALIKGGSTSADAVKKLGRDAKFLPLFSLTNLSAS